MPELPEVEVLVRYLAPLLRGRKIHDVRVARPRVLKPTSKRELVRVLRGARFVRLTRRGKYLLFTVCKTGQPETLLVGHLGMSGRMYFLPKKATLPKHASIVLDLGKERFVFEDTRYFGKFTLDTRSVERLGLEPLSPEFTVEDLSLGFQGSTQPVKVKLLDQTLVAGMGNIYASEALFRAGISPMCPARGLDSKQVRQLWSGIRNVLTEAIERGSTVPLNHHRRGKADGFFYFGSSPEAEGIYEERLHVYGRSGEACYVCGVAIQRCVQAGRSTFYCPQCQNGADSV